MNFYRQLPVFPFDLDWSGGAVTRFNYDLASEQIGFGRVSHDPEQNHLAQGFSGRVALTSIAEIRTLEGFTQRVRGRLIGFWMPGAAAEFDVIQRVDNTHCDIASCGLADSWDIHPCRHLWLMPPSLERNEAIAVRITNVVPIDATTERVTVEETLPVDLSAEWMVCRLHFVRFETDTLSLEHVSPIIADAEIRCYELPLEYTAAELGDRPAYLYRFREQAIQGALGEWLLTSHDVPITWNAQTYAPAPIAHGQLVDSVRGDDDALTLETFEFDGSPLRVFVPFAPQRRMFLEITEVRLDDGVGRLIFSGEVRSVEAKGRKLTANVVTRLDVANRKFPRLVIGRTCSAQLGDAACTKSINVAPFKVAGAITLIDRADVTLPAAGGNLINWFAGGHCVLTGGATGREVRQIVASEGTVLKLNAPFASAQVGNILTAFAGCDRRPKTCQDKFNNFINFQGHPNIGRNLTLKAAQPSKNQPSGKK